ncbi:hypothetical protein Tco_1470417, partial [Tanacetum coccineum]
APAPAPALATSPAPTISPDEMLEFEYSSCDDPSSLWKDLEVNEYTSALFRICRTLRFCGQTVTEGDIYSDLNVNLLVAKKNNELLMKNHQSRPTGSLALPEVNTVNNNDNKISGSKRGRGNPHVRGRGRGYYGHNCFPNRNYTYHRGGYNSRGHGRGRGQGNNTYHAP